MLKETGELAAGTEMYQKETLTVKPNKGDKKYAKNIPPSS
jgi:hypothetical protein